jgi:hypothetical protein
MRRREAWATNGLAHRHPDLIVKIEGHHRQGERARLVGRIDAVPIPLDEDRYVLAVEIKEVNDADRAQRRRDNGRRPLRAGTT